ncbi:hypothetical protein Tco_1015314 [Tanacetum coccineum]|uniref:CCHC-type domain-containing protein n=1 Tax=Tanacetum coccineum TaxID=301880 RepID=A0ABQ5FL60_9ASTR
MECSSCGALYIKSCGCSKGGLIDKFVHDPNKMPDSSQRPPQNYAKCGNPIEDLLNTSESSDDDTNVVNAPREPFVVKQDPGENSSQSPPQINHNCCYECGDSLDGIFCQRCTCKSCGKGAHIGYNCPQKAPIISNPEPCNQTIDELPQTLPSFDPTCYSEKENSLPYVSKPNFVDDSPNVFNPPPQPPIYSCEFCRNDARYGHYMLNLPPCVAITPVLFTEEPVDSLIMEDEHLDTISETESDELIKSSVEDLVQIPSESEDSSEGECDLPPYDDSSKNHDLTFSNPLFDIDEDFTSSDESFSEEDVPNENFKIFSNPLFDLDEEITSTKVDQIDDEIDSLLDEFAGELTLPHSILPGIDPEGDILFLESLLYDNSSPRPPEEFNSENSTVSFSPFSNPIEEVDSFMEDIDIFLDGDDSMPPDIPVDVPHHFCRTHPALQLDFDFIPSNDLGSDLNASSPFGDSNKIYDPGICIEVESTRILATLSPVINTLLPFSSENEDKVFNHSVLAYKEKSPPYSSYRGLKALQLSSKSPMLIHGDNTPDLGVRHPHFYPP